MNDKEQLEALLKECDKEKLHLCGHIQPFGTLIGISKEDFSITYVSQNCETLLHVKPASILGALLTQASPPLWRCVEAFLGRVKNEPFLYEKTSLEGTMLDVKVYDAQSHIILELELMGEGANLNSEALQCGIHLLKPPSSAKELSHYYEILVKGVFDETGYDRVMLYRFGEDWSGEVISECTKEGMGSYLGLRFPASDIPSIARELYLKNSFRHIADTLSSNVPILSLDESTPDLTYSDIRSVSPVHIEYMKNMGMNASFSTPIIVFGTLWGLVACHNTEPKYLSIGEKQACRNLTHSFSIGISSFMTNEKLQKLDSTDRYLNEMMEKVVAYEDILDGFEAVEIPLMQLIACDGMSIAIDDATINIGDVLSEENFEYVDRWFIQKKSESIYATDSLPFSAVGSKINCENVTGILAIKTLTKERRSVRCYWFRNELKQEIAWAGNPNKPVIENAGALKLSPRRSFERWIEVKSGYAKAWNSLENISAMKFNKILYRWL